MRVETAESAMGESCHCLFEQLLRFLNQSVIVCRFLLHCKILKSGTLKAITIIQLK